MKSPRMPSSPRVGILNSSRVCPSLVFISTISPFRCESISITVPQNSSGTSMIACSIGSNVFPFSSRIITSGRDTCSSNPSRRIFSISTERCNSPRPDTLYASPLGTSSTCKPTFVSCSLCNRSFI